MILAAAFLIAAAISLAVTPAVRRIAHRVGAMDHPGDRKVHLSATPRLGGVSVVAGCAGSLALLTLIRDWIQPQPTPILAPSAAPLALGALAVFAVGVRDDVAGATALAKLAVIGAAAAIVLAGGIAIHHFTLFGRLYELGPLAWPVTFVWIVGLTNAFNLVDGLDGLATGLAIIAAATCGLVLVVRGDHPNAIILVALVGAAVGFLPYNFNPASIFLGDCGSLVFGFVLAVTAITGWQKGTTALAVGAPLLVLALPIADAVGSIARRLAGRQPVFAGDQRHIHHWLLKIGLSHRNAVLVLYALASGLAIVAILTADLS